MAGIKLKISDIYLFGLAKIAFLESFLCKKHVIHVSSRVSAPSRNTDLIPFDLDPPSLKKNSKFVRQSLLYERPSSKFRRTSCLWRFMQCWGIFTSKKKLKKTLEFKFKTVNDLKVSGNFFNFSSFKKKNQLIDFSIFITLYKNMMIQ